MRRARLGAASLVGALVAIGVLLSDPVLHDGDTTWPRGFQPPSPREPSRERIS